MKRRLAPVAVAVAALASSATPARAAGAPLHSDNVSLLTTLPEAVGAAGARFSGHYMYVSTWKGLLIYDIAKPEAPQRVSFLALPHFEKEDVDAGNGLVIISNDPSEGMGVVYVIDVYDPALPKILVAVPNGTIAGDLGDLDGNGSATGHIANCIKACRYLWLTGTSQGLSIYDLRNPASPQFVKLVPMPKRKALPGEDPSTIRPGFTHDVDVDSSGIGWVTGEDGTFGFDTRDPVNPKLIPAIVVPHPRETPRWRKLYKGRAAVEREFGRLKNDWALSPLRVRGLDRVRLHADLTILAKLSCALARARAVPLAA